MSSRCICSKIVKFLSKGALKNINEQILAVVIDEPDLLKCDITWVYGYNIETKAPLSQHMLLEDMR